MTSSNPSGIAPHTTARGRRGLPVWQAAVGSAVVAMTVNLIILFVADGAGASLTIELNGRADDIIAGGVVFASVVPTALGVTVAALAARWKPVLLRVAQIVAGALAVLTALGPLTSDTDGGTAAALTVMHLMVGVATVAGIEAVRRARS
ncbi:MULTISPECIES: DUF6069 family protein [Streptomyces]|uniref:Uncharacterized protein n=1 Tax=Streptomyces dengpaensis TaxID=2049881 RepID=A0ABM6SMT6_9ACTN|nr:MULTISPECIES: DUF6069 family protein [Streptomyces]AVH55975.1 hypothetical protein C4B68_09550 [Streptomyces dengpaensis]PIB12224.1 hypothetical protein B1C81_03485 [Streptomyces sp. HG99]